jgi:hypothetical protein
MTLLCEASPPGHGQLYEPYLILLPVIKVLYVRFGGPSESKPCHCSQVIGMESGMNSRYQIQNTVPAPYRGRTIQNRPSQFEHIKNSSDQVLAVCRICSMEASLQPGPMNGRLW